MAASSGVGLGQVESRIATAYAGELELYDVENRLLHDVIDKSSWSDRIRNNAKKRDHAQPNMLDLLEILPKVEFCRLWRKAFGDTIDDISRSNQGGCSQRGAIVFFHLSFYSARRSETYSMVTDVALLLSKKDGICVQRSIILMDDIYDMWSRLEGGDGGSHFGLVTWRNERMGAQLLSLEGDNAVSDEELALLTIESSIDMLGQLMRWRRIDLIAAESLALALKCPLTCLGVKHSYQELRTLIEERNELTTSYLSHPISRPRKNRRSSILNGGHGGWDSIVKGCNGLGAVFAEHGVVLICPTAIDEMRLAPSDQNEGLLARKFQLDERWPVVDDAIVPPVVEKGSELLHCDKVEELRGMDAHELLEKLGEAEGSFARMLENQIYTDVPFRDHYLVANTDNFFAFRPLYEDGHFSPGVSAEIRHWVDSQLVLSPIEEPDIRPKTSRALFVHSSQDIDDLFRYIFKKDGYGVISFERDFRGNFLEAFKRKGYVLDPSDREALYLCSDNPSMMLDLSGGRIPEPVRDDAIQEALKRSFFTELTGIGDDRLYSSGSVQVGIIQNDTLTYDEVKNCAAHLKGQPLDSASEKFFDFYFQVVKQFLSVVGKASVLEWAKDVLKPKRD